AIAGHNDMPHNDNDVGSFMFVRDGEIYLTDPGVHWYTSKTWGPRRYEILYCRSLGHSVPLINGHEQPPGEQYHGTLTTQGLNSGGDRTAVIDMTHAYADRTLKLLERKFVFSPQGVLRLTDTFEFSRKPRSIEDAFVTFQPVTVARSGRAVRIGKGKKSVRMTVMPGVAGRFVVQPMDQFIHEDRWGRVLNRIVFKPARPKLRTALTFEIGGPSA
ncbi:MAG: heparinase II/III family protein, partial [Phycisphaeraceae bacterium]|nr:heparinase II/III family protein [Phycisphaeraceae bacterium]